MSDRRFVAAAAQLTSTADFPANLSAVKELAQAAAAKGVKLLALPENFAFLGERERDKFPHAETLDEANPGPTLTAVLSLARDHQMWISAGGMAERLEADAESSPDELSTTYNTHFLASPAGEIAARYRKIHLFDIEIPGQTPLRESDNTSAGKSVVVASSEVGTLGLSICYDLRFPELYRQQAISSGAEILLVPAAFTAHTGAAHWHTLLRARAIENQCWVIAAAQAGRHNPRRRSYGHSLIINPWGDIVAECNEQNGLAVAEIDLDQVTETRKNMPCHAHQRVSFQTGKR